MDGWSRELEEDTYQTSAGATTSLLRDTNAAQEVGEAGVPSQRVESGIHPDKGHSIRTDKIGFIEPGEGLLVITQRGVDAGNVETADVTFAGLF